VDVNLTDGQTHDLELYFLDWDKVARSEIVTISNATTGALISTKTVSSFQSGAYLEWAVSGNVLFTITSTTGSNAVLSGLFFGPPAVSNNALTISPVAPGEAGFLSPISTIGMGTLDFIAGDPQPLESVSNSNASRVAAPVLPAAIATFVQTPPVTRPRLSRWRAPYRTAQLPSGE
jgi:hypothetical protein